MTNHSNYYSNSQHFNADSEQKKIIDTLYRCSQEELLLILYGKKVGRGIDSTDVRQYLLYSDSAASSILRRLTDRSFNKRLIAPIMTRDKSGARGAFLYFVKEEVKLEDIERICQERKYSYQEFIENQKRKNSKQDDATYQEESNKTSTDIPTQEYEVNGCKEEKEQTKTSKTVDSEDTTTKSAGLDDSLPFVFEVFKNKLAEKERKLAEKDMEIQQLKSELEKVTTMLLARA